MSESTASKTALAVTVIIPTYNRGHLICESLDAVLDQLSAADEVIVVIDGSSDNTEKKLAQYGDAIRVISQANSGKAAALNRAMLEAKGEMVWIVDDDDIVTGDARDRLVSALQNDFDAGFAYGRHDRFSIDTTTGARRHYDTGYWCDCAPAEFLCATLEDFFAHQTGMMVRRSLYEQVGPFANVYAEDYEMLIRLAVAAKPAKPLDGIVFHQRQHQGLRGTAANPLKSTQRDQAWRANGQSLIQQHLAALPLERFVPAGEGNSVLARRSAWLQRGVILARHGLWEAALNEFQTAADLSAKPLTQAEIRVLRRTSQSKFEFASFLSSSEVEAGFSGLAKLSDSGREIVRAIGRSFVWRAKRAAINGEFATTAKLGRRILNMWVLGR